MITIGNASTPLLKYDKEPLTTPDGEILTLRRVIMVACGNYSDTDPEKNVMAYKIGQKAYDAKGILDLEDAEFKELKNSILKPNRPNFSAIVMGQVYIALEEAELAAREKIKERK